MMWKNNRPPDWNAIVDARIKKVNDFPIIHIGIRDNFEAGADALLDALKSKGSFMNPEQMKLIAPDRKYPYGWLVFIEESK